MLLHGFMDTWRTWELVLPALERRHEVLALTLAGHAGGPELTAPTADALLDAVAAAMDDAGWPTAHLVGNSLGGALALRLAMRDRARSVVAFAPAGGWAPDDPWPRQLLRLQRAMHAQARTIAAQADALVATPEGRRLATRLTTVSHEHLPAELLAHATRGVAACPGAHDLLTAAEAADWAIEPARISCPVRVVWGAADRLLPWPSAAARYREAWLPHADWVVLDDVGHCPQLDVPAVTADLVLGWTA